MRAIASVENKKQIKELNPAKMQRTIILFFVGWVAIFITIDLIETLTNINILRVTGY